MWIYVKRKVKTMKVNSIKNNLSITQKQKNSKDYSTTSRLMINSKADSVSFGTKFPDPQDQKKFNETRSQRPGVQRFFRIGIKEDINKVVDQSQREKLALMTQVNVDKALLEASAKHLEEMKDVIKQRDEANEAKIKAMEETRQAQEATIFHQGKAVEAANQLAETQKALAAKYESLYEEQKQLVTDMEIKNKEREERMEEAIRQGNEQRIKDIENERLKWQEFYEKQMADIINRKGPLDRMQKNMEEMENMQKKDGFGKIAGYESQKKDLMNLVGNPILYEKNGETVSVPNGILFHGPKGNGKTTFAEAFAGQLGCNLIKITNFLDDKENLKHLRNEAQKAQEHFEKTGIRTILQIDEIEKFVPKGSDITEPMKSFMDNASKDFHCTVFATTNHPDEIDDILFRYKRFDVRVGLPPANKQNVIEILKHYTLKLADKDVKYDELAEQIVKVQPDEAFSNAKIEGLVGKFIKTNVKTLEKITHADLLQVIKEAHPDIGKEAMAMFREHIDLVARL